MLTQPMLRKHEEKEVFLEKEKKPLFVAALDLSEFYTQIKYQRLFFFYGRTYIWVTFSYKIHDMEPRHNRGNQYNNCSFTVAQVDFYMINNINRVLTWSYIGCKTYVKSVGSQQGHFGSVILPFSRT